MSGVRVLVADDDPLSRAMVTAMLRGEGYEVEVAVDGNEAWARLQAADPARLVVLDWDMPGLAGVDVCRQLRASAPAMRAYVILLTSRDTPEDIAAAFSAGADDYVVKPARQHELLARVRVGRHVVALQERLASGARPADAGIIS